MYLSYYPYPIISFSDTLHIGSLFSPYYTAHNTHEDLASPSWPHFPQYPCNNNRSIHCTWFLVVGLHMGKHHGHLQIILQAKMFVSFGWCWGGGYSSHSTQSYKSNEVANCWDDALILMRFMKVEGVTPYSPLRVIFWIML